MSVEEDIEIALFERAKEYTDLPLFFPNFDEVPPIDGSSFVEVRHFRNGSRIITFNDEDYFVGMLQMMVCCPLGQGPGEARKRAADIVELFPKNLSLWNNSTRVKIAKRPVLGSALPVKVKYQLPVSIYYEASI
jgi:hypothetical protein